jgi:hypothetical protein
MSTTIGTKSSKKEGVEDLSFLGASCTLFLSRVFSRGVSFYLGRFLTRQHCTTAPIIFVCHFCCVCDFVLNSVIFGILGLKHAILLNSIIFGILVLKHAI